MSPRRSVPRRRPASGPRRGSGLDRSERGWGTHWRTDGRPKTAYSQSLAAERVREMELADLDDGTSGAIPSAYQCAHCGRWHVGNRHRRDLD